MKIKWEVNETYLKKKKEHEEWLNLYNEEKKKQEEAWNKLRQEIEARLMWGNGK